MLGEIKLEKFLRHVVFFKYKPEYTDQQKDEFRLVFSQLSQKISLIKHVEWGLNNSPEHLNHGYTDCFISHFSSEKDLVDYLAHPVHLEFVAKYKPMLDDVCVLDFWPQ